MNGLLRRHPAFGSMAPRNDGKKPHALIRGARLSNFPRFLLRARFWRAAMRTKGYLLLRMHNPFEMAIWAFGVNVRHVAFLPKPDSQPNQEDDKVFAYIFQYYVKYSFMPMIMPICGDVVQEKHDKGNGKNVPSIAPEEGHRCALRNASIDTLPKLPDSYARSLEF